MTAATATACDHCGLPVPAGLHDPDGDHQFCCPGCRTVFEVIHAAGFGAYYARRETAPKQKVETRTSRFEELDDPAFIDQYCPTRPDGLRTTDLYLEGVHCAACVWLIEKSMAHEDGVAEAKLNFVRARLSLRWRPEERSLSSIAQRLAALGYVPHPVRGGAEDAKRKEERQLLIRIGVAAAVAGNVMLMAFALYGGWLSGMDEGHRQLFRFLSLVVTLPAIVYAAAPFYRSAAAGLRAGLLHMDLPISLGISAGFLGGVVNTLRGQGEIYFDSVTTLIFLLLLGRLLQLRQQRRASERSELLYALAPSSAQRIDADGSTHRVPLEAIRVGDRLEVRAGERIATDGMVVGGRSTVDQSLFSGESMPVSVGLDDRVWGGTVNMEDTLHVRVTSTIRSSRVGRIADMVVEAARSRAPVVRLADRVAGYFVGLVLVAAVLTYVAWSFIESSLAVDRAVALLIVSCPCALGLATPLAIAAGIGKGAQKGILARSGAALETLGSLTGGHLFFDKTGTLTYGRMEIIHFQGPDWVRPLIVAAERESSHPVGRALRQGLQDVGARVEAEHVEAVSSGVVARVQGRDVLVGSAAFVAARARYAPLWRAAARRWSKDALTPIWVAVDGQVCAAAALADRVRPEAKACIADLTRRGFRVAILSGDHPSVTAAVGRRLGLPEARCHGGLTPEDKLARVERADGPVVMVGDGVNDAAALAAATVGVAVHGGAETCFAAADVFLQKPGVATLLDLIEGARRTAWTIRANIIFSLFYNAFGATLAIGGWLNPLVAAILMPISSLVVVTHSFRFRF